MERLVRRFIIFHTLIFTVTGVGGWLILNYFFPNFIIKGYFFITVFFYVLGIIFISLFRNVSIDKPNRIVNLYMLMRMIKIFTSLVIILVYWFVHKPGVKNFAIVFIIYYLINLIWETYAFTKMEDYIKKLSDGK
jgi:hypothetical protein